MGDSRPGSLRSRVAGGPCVSLALAALTGCATLPVGTVNGKVASRYPGPGLALAAARPAPLSGTASEHQRESAAQRTAAEPESAKSYFVQPGDTLWSIARRHNTSVAELMTANGLKAPELLAVNARLTIPGAKGLVRAPDPQPVATESVKPRGLSHDTGQAPAASRRRYALQWPLEGTISSRFGARGKRQHDGIDISAPAGTPVRAAASGTVLFAAKQGGYGNLILIRHDDGLITVYAHNERNQVHKGQRVVAGEVIGRVGSTGRSSGPHLHLEVRRGVRAENPLGFLPP